MKKNVIEQDNDVYSPSPEKGFMVRVFDGNLSQTKEEAYDKHMERQMNLKKKPPKPVARGISRTSKLNVDVIPSSRPR